jgi:hypothetical protein
MMPRNEVIFVLGAARSGTSALTRVLSLCGCSLPKQVFAPNGANPKGFWEPAEAARLNIEFLTKQRSMLEDPTFRMLENKISAEESEAFIEEIQAFLSECPHRPITVIKELRVALLMEFWMEAARRCSVTSKIVIAVRHPTEVAASLSQFGKLAEIENPKSGVFGPVSLEMASANWLKLNLVAERNSRTLPRVFVDYGNLMSDWRREVSRISRTLGLDLRINGEAVDKFLTDGLRRQRSAGPPTDAFAYAWISRVHAVLSSAAKDGTIDTEELDEIYDAFRINERAFRIALEESRHRFEVVRAFQRDELRTIPVWTEGVEF